MKCTNVMRPGLGSSFLTVQHSTHLQQPIRHTSSLHQAFASSTAL